MGEYEEYLANPALATRFRSAYRGRHDPADAVWWLSKPGTVAPSGAAAPDQTLGALQHSAYARDATPAAATALARLQAELAADREATLAALGEARSLPPVAPAPDGEPDAARLFEEEDPEIPPRSRVALAVALVAIAALILGGWVGLQLGGSAVAAPQPTVTSTYSAPNLWPNEKPQMLDIFNRSQTKEDADVGDLGGTFDTASFRSLGGYNDWAVFAARNTAGSVCIVLMVGDDDKATTFYCVPESQLPRTGLTVSLQNDTAVYTATWSANGSFESGARPL